MLLHSRGKWHTLDTISILDSSASCCSLYFERLTTRKANNIENFICAKGGSARARCQLRHTQNVKKDKNVTSTFTSERNEKCFQTIYLLLRSWSVLCFLSVSSLGVGRLIGNSAFRAVHFVCSDLMDSVCMERSVNRLLNFLLHYP